MDKRYVVHLTAAERDHLRDFVFTGARAAHKITHADILLSADAHGPVWADKAIAEAFSGHANTLRNARRSKRLRRRPMVPAQRSVRLAGPRLFSVSGKSYVVWQAGKAPERFLNKRRKVFPRFDHATIRPHIV